MHFRELDDEAAARALGDWARDRDIEVDFHRRRVAIGAHVTEAIYVVFKAH